MSVNKVIIIGNLGADPEIKTFNNGGKIANISVATSEKWTDRTTGEKREQTEWHRIIFNDRLADIVEQYLRKGSKVYIEGSLRTRKWQDQTGQDRYTTEIRAQNMQMLDSRSNQDGYGNNNNNYNNNYNNSYNNNGGYNNNNYNNSNYNNNNYNNGYGNQGGYQGNNYNNNPHPNQRNQGGYPNNQYQGNQTPNSNNNPMAGNPSSNYNEPNFNPADNNYSDDPFDNDNSINNTPNDNSFGTPKDDYPPAKASKNSTKPSTDIDDDDMPF